MSIEEKEKALVLSLDIDNDSYVYASSITAAIDAANQEVEQLQETIDSVKELKPECDKTDYILAACSGVVCGIIDIFLVGKPGESPIGNITDAWFTNRTKDFAKLCGWEGEDDKSAIRFLENHFKVPYDQRGAGDGGKVVSGMTPSNHHFKSLAHNPSILGLFFSILDQFNSSSHFVGADIFGGENITLISLEQVDDSFELRGNNVLAKFFCAFVNWFGHLMSDISGSSGGVTRGKGIPSPLWSWCNDIIVLKSKIGIPSSKFDESFYKTAEHLFRNSYDIRFQTAQVIPVLINEMLVRFLYMVRRLIGYINEEVSIDRSIDTMWDRCKPFSNATVKRMLTVAHGTFCLMDVADATIRATTSPLGGMEFLYRVNIPEIGRFVICLYAEAKESIIYNRAKQEALFAQKERIIADDYIEGLKILAHRYDDQKLLQFTKLLQNPDQIKEAFQKSAELAAERGVEDGVNTLQNIQDYFL